MTDTTSHGSRLLTDEILLKTYIEAVSVEDVCKHVYYEQTCADTMKRIQAIKNLVYPLAFAAGEQTGYQKGYESGFHDGQTSKMGV